MKLAHVMLGSIRKGLAEMCCGLGSGERLQLQSQSVGRRIKDVLSMAAAKDHETHATWQCLAQQITHERTRLTYFLGSNLCVVRSIDYDAEHCLRMSMADECDGLAKPAHKNPKVGGRICVNCWDQKMAKASPGKFVCDLDERFLMAMSVPGRAAILTFTEAVVQYRHRTFRQEFCDTRGKHRLTDTAYRVDNDWPFVSFYYRANKARLLFARNRVIDSLDQASRREQTVFIGLQCPQHIHLGDYRIVFGFRQRLVRDKHLKLSRRFDIEIR